MKKNIFIGWLLVVGLLLGGVNFLAQGKTILIKKATIVPVVGPKIVGGDLLIEKGQIVKLGRNLKAPEGAIIIEAEGDYVYPGLISSFTAIGVTGYPGAGNDLNEVGISTPQMDPYEAINPEDDCIAVTRLGGITTVLTISGTQNIICGQAVVLNLYGDFPCEMLVKRRAAMIFNIGAKQQNRYPSTIPGVMAFLRDKFEKVKLYQARKKETSKSSGKVKARTSKSSRQVSSTGPGFDRGFSLNLEYEALIPVLEGQIPALFIANDEVTLRNSLRLIKEYHLKGIIYSRKGVRKFLPHLAQEKIPLIWAGTMTIPDRWQAYDYNYRMAAEIARQGILFAFEQAGWGPGSRNVRNLPVPVAMSVAHGLSEEEALRAMTIYPAKILGIDDKLGSLEPGKKANVVIWTGSPIQLTSRVKTLIIKGEIVPLESVQTRLRDRYEKIVRQRLKAKKK